ncbi:hypothetical protein [Mesonia maritima]|uniref:Uncharacterized protein n=1 Tax=Mesonia maritima TaxID=1793873 RepID=A0ABU1K5C7_9FLAO|nr:hypothetical protein [Mesonia maritima]MDR6299773.1 hypothetical protein [Mesonia maritima]
MKVSFTTKAESNKMQQTDFLKLSPSERFYAFLELSYRLKDFPKKNKQLEKGENFIIQISNAKRLEK